MFDGCIVFLTFLKYFILALSVDLPGRSNTVSSPSMCYLFLSSAMLLLVRVEIHE